MHYVNFLPTYCIKVCDVMTEGSAKPDTNHRVDRQQRYQRSCW